MINQLLSILYLIPNLIRNWGEIGKGLTNWCPTITRYKPRYHGLLIHSQSSKGLLKLSQMRPENKFWMSSGASDNKKIGFCQISLPNPKKTSWVIRLDQLSVWSIWSHRQSIQWLSGFFFFFSLSLLRFSSVVKFFMVWDKNKKNRNTA
jgi:hypothetical protein